MRRSYPCTSSRVSACSQRMRTSQRSSATGVAVVVATRDEELRAEITRGWGPSLSRRRPRAQPLSRARPSTRGPREPAAERRHRDQLHAPDDVPERADQGPDAARSTSRRPPTSRAPRPISPRSWTRRRRWACPRAVGERFAEPPVRRGHARDRRAVRPDARPARRRTAVTGPIALESILPCLQGVIPSPFATCSPDGTPNITYMSIVHYIDSDRVALSRQFFNKTRANLDANPFAQVRVVDPGLDRGVRDRPRSTCTPRPRARSSRR